MGHIDGSVTVGDRILRSAGMHDVWVAELEPDGRAGWLERLGGPGTEYGHAIVAGDREVLVAGSFDGTTRLCGGDPTSRGESDGYVVWRSPPLAAGR